MDIQSTIEVALQVIGVASIVAAVTPTPVDNVVLAVLKKVLNITAMNVGKAKNADG